MIGSIPLALFALTSPPATVQPVQPARPARVAFQDEEVPDKRPELAELLDQLADHLKMRGEEDREVVGVVDQLTQEFPESGPKDKQAIVKALDKVIKAKRKKNKEGIPENRIHVAAATGLGTMAPESVKTLEGWIDKKPHEKDVVVQRALILSLGKCADDKASKRLMDLLQHNLPEIQAATAEALANYGDADVRLRKEIFKEALDVLMAVRSVIDQDQDELIEHKRWDVISGPIMSTLMTLSGHREQDAHRWQRWWNKNKKVDWDEDFEG